MNLVYAVDKASFTSEDHIGVNNKVNSQIEQMRIRGIEVILQEYEWENGYPQIEITNSTDVLYFRRIESSVKLILKLRQLKKISPNLKIVMEIPTYPFEGEEVEKKSLKRKISVALGTNLLHFYIDRIVLCGQQEKIKKLFQIPVIHFNNGVDFDKVPVNTDSESEDDYIHMICVSGCMLAHGYDRMIEGIREYYLNKSNTRKVFFHIVGVGEYKDQYVRLAEEYNLLDKTIFVYGKKVGKELDEVFNICNIAVGHLATHRIGIFFSSALKTREYVARGLPVVTSCMLDIYEDSIKDYILFVPEDESPINIAKIVDFYDNLYQNGMSHKEIREKFYRLCDWKYTFASVIEYLLQKDAK